MTQIPATTLVPLLLLITRCSQQWKEGICFKQADIFIPGIALLTSPELEWLRAWRGTSCFESSSPRPPPACASYIPTRGLLQHMLLPSGRLALDNYLKLSPLVLSFPLFCLYFASKGPLPPFLVLFCFLFSRNRVCAII